MDAFGIRLEDRLAPSSTPLIYLDFDGGAGLTYTGPVRVEGLDVPAFSASAVGAAGQESAIERDVAAALNARFAGVAEFVLAPASEPHSTIVVGGTDARFRPWGSFFGLAEKNDVGNLDPFDRALVFSEVIAEQLADPSRESFAVALTDVIGHETRRLLGLEPVVEGLAGLAAVASQSGEGFQWPIVPAGQDGRRLPRVTQDFGKGFGSVRGHLGTDFAGSTGTPVYSIGAGKVTKVLPANDPTTGPSWGNVIIVEHKTTEWGWDKDVYSMYAHLGSSLVLAGQRVSRGQQLSTVGPTAQGSTGPHLHLEIRSGIEAWRRPGPGYRGFDFDRHANSTATRSDYPNLKWHDPVRTIQNDLYVISTTATAPRATAGEFVTIETRIAASVFPQDKSGRPDLTQATMVGSLVGMPQQVVTSNLNAPGAATYSAEDSEVVVMQTFQLSGNGGSVVRPNSVINIASTRINVTATADLPIDPVFDPFGAFAQRFPSLLPTPQDWLQQYARSMHPDLGTSLSETTIMKALARRAVQIDVALPASGLSSITPEQFQTGLRNAYGETTVKLHNRWDPSLPTVVLVHGIRTDPSFHIEVGQPLAHAVRSANGAPHVNVITFYWGRTETLNGLDRTLREVIRDANSDYIENDEFRNLKGSIDLHLLIKLLGRVYGPTGKDRINLIAHSQGTVVTAGALSLRPPGPADPLYDINQTLFIGANIQMWATAVNNEFDHIRRQSSQLLKVVNLTSLADDVLKWSSYGATNPAGYSGFDPGHEAQLNSGLPAGQFYVRSIPVDDTFLQIENARYPVRVEHTGDLSFAPAYYIGGGTVVDVGWLKWLIVKEQYEDFVIRGTRSGFERAVFDDTSHGSAPVRINANGVSGDENPTPVGRTFVASRGTAYDFPTGGGQMHSGAPLAGQPIVVPRVTAVTPAQPSVPRGTRVVLTASASAAVGRRLARLEAFLDSNDNAHPDPGELLAVDYDPSRPLQVAIDTRGLASGTYAPIFRVADDQETYSELFAASFAVTEAVAPVVPATLSIDTKPDFGIVLQRNGDVSYPQEDYVLGKHRGDVWLLSPAITTASGFTITTVGPTDTVLAIYDATTGLLIQSNEDSGPGGSNAQITLSLAGGKAYFVYVATQRNSTGNYGLQITGPNQEVTANIATPAGAYTGTFSGSIDVPFRTQYFELLVPTGATELSVVLNSTSTLDGYVRVSNGSHATLQTAFLSGVGSRDFLSNIPVTAGETLFVTVTGMYGTTGAFTLTADFGPDANSLPTAVNDAAFAALTPLVPLPDGTLRVDATIAAPGQIRYVLVIPPSSGEYAFETIGDLDTQLGVYAYNGGTNATLLESDDDAAGGGNARVVRALTAGNFYLVAVRADGSAVGNYALLLRQTTPDPVTPIPLFGLERAGSRDANYSPGGQYSHFRIDVPAGATAATVRVIPTQSSPTVDLVLRISDAAGTVLATVDASGQGGIEQVLNLTVVGGGPLFVTVAGKRQIVNEFYRVEVDLSPDATTTVGQEFPVAEGPAPQEFPRVARMQSGAVVAIWVEQVSGERVLRFRRFGSDGQPVGGVADVNQTTGFPSWPVVAAAADGSFVIAWSLSGTVWYRRYDANGVPLSGEVRANDPSADATESAIAIAPDGTFVIAWTSFSHGDPDGGVYARRFTSSGVANGPEIHVNVTTARYQAGPTVGMGPDGSFLIAWQNQPGASSSVNEIVSRSFGPDGTPRTGETRLSSGGSALYPRLAVAPDGSSVVVWRQVGPVDANAHVFFQRIDALGLPLGVPVEVGDGYPRAGIPSLDRSPDVAFGPANRFLVVWGRPGDGDGYGAAAQQFRADGTPVGGGLLTAE